MQLRQITINGTAFNYYDSDPVAKNSSPVALIHGFPLDVRMWEAQVAELGSKYRIIVPELRGFGTSLARDPITTESLADDVRALLKEIGALPAVIGGLSLGGYVALAYAKKYASDLRALMLIDTRAEADSEAGRRKRDSLIALLNSKGHEAVVDQFIGGLVAPDVPSRRPQLVAALHQMMMDCAPATLGNALVALRDRPDQTEMLATISVPTLILVGESDAITPPQMAETMHRHIPHSRLETIRGSGHLSTMEQPAQVNRAIDRFLRGLSGRSQQNAMR